jgi:hypothetical protein
LPCISERPGDNAGRSEGPVFTKPGWGNHHEVDVQTKPVGPTQRRLKKTDIAAIADMTLNSLIGDLDVSNIQRAHSPIKPPTASKSKGSTCGGVMKTLFVGLSVIVTSVGKVPLF